MLSVVILLCCMVGDIALCLSCFHIAGDIVCLLCCIIADIACHFLVPVVPYLA